MIAATKVASVESTAGMLLDLPQNPHTIRTQHGFLESNQMTKKQVRDAPLRSMIPIDAVQECWRNRRALSNRSFYHAADVSACL
mmetsp:Transcript_55648/g.46854  ORF Transcript_55648/g.46854 Transcript_55648/m.46854 type:complete len:84 (+) Transcript_55648:296-547(+)